MVVIAFKMLLDDKLRLGITVLGITALFFLSAALCGVLVGWCLTTTAIIRHSGADVWVMGEGTPAFDFGTAIVERRIYQVRSVPGVEWAEGMFASFTTWQRSDGGSANVEIIGLDESCVGGPWDLKEGRVEDVHLPESVIVDDLYLTLYAVTQANLGNYAALIALGFSRRQLSLIVLVQSLVLGLVGALFGSGLFFYVAALSTRTPLCLETTPAIFAGLVLTSVVEIRRKWVGFVFQQAHLLPFLNMDENVRVIARNAGMSSRDTTRRIGQLFDRLGVSHLSRKSPWQASGGERQRVAMARAIIHRPPIVLADEPTAALDWQNGQLAIRLLTELVDEERSVLIAVTHDTRLLGFFNRVFHIDQGVLSEQ